MKQNPSRQLSIEDNEAARVLYGQNNENLKFIERTLNVKIGARGGELCVDGEPADAALAFDVVSQLAQLVAAGYPLETKDVSQALRIIAKDRTTKLPQFMLSSVRGGAARRFAR
jgi:phosphate starvation-inducible PhoH-like protein